MSEPIVIARDDKGEIYILPQMTNRHGMIAGATGTGKSVTLRVIAENFSRLGVPVFLSDVKGDMAGMAFAGGDNPKVEERVKQFNDKDFKYKAYPVVFWDIFGEQGHPLRTTISEMGPLLLSRILNLNDTQSGVLSLVFKAADDKGLLLLDMKDLRAMLKHVGDNASSFSSEYGNVSGASIGAIQRRLLEIEQQGGENFFGEPALKISDMMRTDSNGMGIVNILAADRLMQSPQLYAVFLLWLMSELFEELPETGDPEKPKMIFFFDEAHLLFTDAPQALLQKIEQVVRLIRSKGIGIFFVSQNPTDIPDTVLGQLGNRVQHALRAYTPRDQKAIKAAATTFRQNPDLNIEKVITELNTGEALVSMLDQKGAPEIVRRAYISPPESKLGAITALERNSIIQSSPLKGIYDNALDRESAYELLMQRQQQAVTTPPPPSSSQKNDASDLFGAFAKSAARAIGSSTGRQIMRGILGGIFKSK